ncbi:MAG: biosynthetic arginine decarboxylase [Gammaproteobacteria bacterium]|nr:biosynthetic arginine decarboxylase [Gammaproteobacteria bacterium]
MNDWSIAAAEELYRIGRWGEGFFRVAANGRLQMCLPANADPVTDSEVDAQADSDGISLQDVVDELNEQGVAFPIVLRFHDVLKQRVRELNQAFVQAIDDAGYEGVYRGVFPIKVNQMREVVDEIVTAGREFHYGLEAGSKAELLAVLAYDTTPEALTICNGYKDEDYLRLALLGNRLKRKVIVVVEKYSEIDPLLRLAQQMNVRPLIGLRIKMRVKTEGRWSGSSGEHAKFGLTTSELLNAIALIQSRGFLDSIVLLHFHIGSQLSDIRYVQVAVQEAARIYARLHKRGVPLQYLDVGGGLGVDYDGSRSRGESSMNYSVHDYANVVVQSVKQTCELEQTPHPTLVSESGRAVAAHHSCVIIRVLGEIASDANPIATDATEREHRLVTSMRRLLEQLDSLKNHQQAYNDASYLLDDALDGFKLGVIGLEDLARVETLYWRLLRAISRGIASEEFVSEELRNVDAQLASQYLCNFSLFQSAADSWAIGQVLPVVPLTRLNEEPTRHCTLADITCDSDGKISNFIGPHGTQDTLPLHRLDNGEHYYVGLFLTGAYQDVMGDMHNLFGRLNEAHVFHDPEEPGGFFIEEVVPGTSAGQVLTIMQYNTFSMAENVKRRIDAAVRAGEIGAREGVRLVDFYESCLGGYTYLR